MKIISLPTSLIAFTISVLSLPAISTASSSQVDSLSVCSKAQTSIAITKFTSSYTTYCSRETIVNSTVAWTYFGHYSSGTKGGNDTTCGKEYCLRAFNTLTSSCSSNNVTISGTGHNDNDCGIYTYKIDSPPSPTAKPGSETGVPSAAGLAKVSGGLIVGVAGIFIGFL